MSQDCLPELLCTVDFPTYCVSTLSPRHILLAGGGGAAKTGVKNGMEIFELSHDGKATRAMSVTRIETGEFAVMNMAMSRYDPDSLTATAAVGHNEKCQLYNLELSRDVDASMDNGGPKDIKNGHNYRKLVFQVTPTKNVQTDYNMPEPYQKVVRISSNNQYLATGGDDGYLRIWTFPDLYRTHEIEAHEKEIDDLDFSPDNSKIVSISKDRRAYIWDVKKGKKHAEMGYETPKGVKYLFKRVRFGRVEGDSKKYKVFSISNPVGASKPPSVLQRWDGKTFTVEQAVTFNGSLSALAVSDNGHFVAIGSMFDGTVQIFTTFNLQILKRVEKAHSTFITGLEFLPTTSDADVIRGFSDASVVSISVDHQVCIHHIPRLKKVSMVAATFFMACLLILTFILCSYLGL